MKKVYITLDAQPILEKRLSLFVNAVMIIMVFLLCRFWYLQIFRHSYYLELSEKSRMRNFKIVAPRGFIRDRKGKIIASSAPNFVLEITREEVVNKDEIFRELSKIFGLEKSELEKLYKNRDKITPKFYPVLLFENLSREQIVAVEALKWKLKGTKISYRSERSYPFNNLASHLLGYVSQINREDIEKLKGYQIGSKVGKAGLESSFEPYLRGFDGVERIEVDAYGKKQKVLYRLDPIAGGNVDLTIDWDLQEAAEAALGDKNGAVVAISAITGEVLAMTSHPNFDPNLFVRGFKKEEWLNIAKNPFHPLQNKAIQGIFPPGSTFKLVTAIAGLEEGVIDRNTHFYCSGKKRIGNRDFRCWKDSGHGTVDVHKAIVESCDVFFYETALKLGPEKLAYYAKKLGLGEKTGIGLSGELSGIVPSPEWKKSKFNQRWYDGDTLPFAIGQGYLAVTPLQLALAYAAFSNGGTLLKPVIVKQFEGKDGKMVVQNSPQIRSSLSLKPETIEIVRKGLIGVVNEGSGTGHAAYLPEVIVAGKTGTAQVRSFKERVRLSGFKNDHAWFVGFAPAYNPEVVVCAFVMHGGHGGGAAAPIVKAVLEKYFSVKRTSANGKDIEQ
ncbi:MAG: penicillin-binding protein 2 [bacterium]